MTTATTPSPNDRPRLKVELRKLSGEEADWNKWHKVYSSQARKIRLRRGTDGNGRDGVGAEDFNSQGIDPLRAKRASEAWLSLITTCKVTALEIVQSADSPNAAWRELLQRSRACCLNEKSRLAREFNSPKMELEEDPKKFTIESPGSRDEVEKPSMTTTRS